MNKVVTMINYIYSPLTMCFPQTVHIFPWSFSLVMFIAVAQQALLLPLLQDCCVWCVQRNGRDKSDTNALRRCGELASTGMTQDPEIEVRYHISGHIFWGYIP